MFLYNFYVEKEVEKQLLMFGLKQILRFGNDSRGSKILILEDKGRSDSRRKQQLCYRSARTGPSMLLSWSLAVGPVASTSPAPPTETSPMFAKADQHSFYLFVLYNMGIHFRVPCFNVIY
jgi:hypothetical protein